MRQAGMLALSGFMLMSSLAALGSELESPEEAPPTLESKAWQDSSTQLARSDYGTDSAGPSRVESCPAEVDEGATGWIDPLRAANDQPDETWRLSSRASRTYGCSSSTRSSSSVSTS
jgi:hypothetical protein